MRGNGPPSIATWMLVHFIPGGHDEGLAGDLCEEFRSGRSTFWYWRQVSSAIAIGWYRAAGSLGAAAIFALVWSMLAPAWLLAVASVEQHADLGSRFWRMDWPWSTVCDLGLLLLADVLFIWIGIVLYMGPDLLRSRGRRVRQVCRGVAASIPALVVVLAALVAMPKYFIDIQTTGQRSLGPVSTYAITQLDPPAVRRLAPREEWRAQYGDPGKVPVVSPLTAITDVHGVSVLVRLPFFLVILCALGRVGMPGRNEHEVIPSEGH